MAHSLDSKGRPVLADSSTLSYFMPHNGELLLFHGVCFSVLLTKIGRHDKRMQRFEVCFFPNLFDSTLLSYKNDIMFLKVQK